MMHQGPRSSKVSLAEVMDEQYALSLSDQADVVPQQQVATAATAWGGHSAPAAQVLRQKLQAEAQAASSRATAAHALQRPAADPVKVSKMVAMGIASVWAAAALQRTNNNIAAAVALCFETDMDAMLAQDTLEAAAQDNVEAAAASGSQQSRSAAPDAEPLQQPVLVSSAEEVPVNVAEHADRDMALALHMQELERVQAHQAMAKRGQVASRRGGSGNVSIGQAHVKASSPQVVSQRWGAEDADACNAAVAAEAHAQELASASDAASGEASSQPPAQVSATIVGGGGRRRSKADLYRLPSGQIVSKHDAELCGQANARDLSGFAGVGDLSVDKVRLDNQTANALRVKLMRASAGPKGVAATGRVEKSLHATREGVLDSRTRLLLHSMVNAGGLLEVGGAVKAGKEACVFYGLAPPASAAVAVTQGTTFSQSIAKAAAASAATAALTTGQSNQPRAVAIKVFKTTLNEFANRQDYVEGDPRYRDVKFNKQGRAKMFRIWAEKEARNLTRACKAGLSVPAPLLQRQHVLVMDFLGDDGWPAPQLKEVELDSERWWRAYVECLEAARLLLLRCSLVHGDLSEYNVLYHNETCHFIDFGQSVHKAHPRAMELLARDLNTMEAFMEKRRVQRLGGSLAFAFVTQYVGANELAGAALQALSISKAEDDEEAALALLQDLNAEAVKSGETEEDIEAEDEPTGDELAGDDVDEVAEDDEEAAHVEHQGNNAGDKVDLAERERARTQEARMWARAEMAPTDYSI
eukprot:TRINITY_DN704_c0_g2_i5.p1 TRINITY_DN704_c0_g2~~TRINITY_DN704_c0_g2_i5.p1  ORF type:complete len:755 (-),score=153.86 TRINITY_DN704_c0_g2_i5:46-2310(-)